MSSPHTASETPPLNPSPAAAAAAKKAAIGWHALAGLVALGIGAAGANKLLQAEEARAAFEGMGLPGWAAYVTGAVEVVSAVLLIVPRVRGWGAALVTATMIGALATHALQAHALSQWVPALVFLALAGLLTWRAWVSRRG
jgi:uncharacterized membrane protein YphA (DoxX/SURF4 family)